MPHAPKPGRTLAAVCFGLFMVGLDATVVSIANPAIAADLHTSFAQLQWVTNSYLLALAVLLVLGGKLGDRFGRKRLYLTGVLLFGVASVGIAVIGSAPGVIALRAVQGAAAAILMPQTLALLRATWPRERFGMAVGIWGGVSSVAIAAGPIVAGVLVARVSWESVFYLNAPIALIGLVFGARVLSESTAEQDSGRFDLLGVLLLALGLFLVVFAVVQSGSWGWTSSRTWVAILAGLLVLITFGYAEGRVSDPLIPPTLLRSTGVSIGGLVFLANFFAMLGITFLVTLYLMTVRGDGTIMAGVKMLPMSAVAIPAAPIGAVLTSRFGARAIASVGLILMGASLAFLVGNSEHSGYLWLAIPFIGIALGSGFAIPAGAEAIIGGSPVHLAGVAGGFQTTCLQVGGALGTAVLSAVLSSHAGGTDVPTGSDFVDGMKSAAVVAAAVAIVVGLGAFAFLRDRGHVSTALVLEELVEGEAGHL